MTEIIFLGSAMLFGVCFGTSVALTWAEWKHKDWPTRFRFMNLTVLFGILVYGYVESYAYGVQLAPRHYVYIVVGVLSLVTLIWSMMSLTTGPGLKATSLLLHPGGMTRRDEPNVEVYNPTEDPSSYEGKPDQDVQEDFSDD